MPAVIVKFVRKRTRFPKSIYYRLAFLAVPSQVAILHRLNEIPPLTLECSIRPGTATSGDYFVAPTPYSDIRFPPTEPIPTGIEDGRHGASLAGLSTGAVTNAEKSSVVRTAPSSISIRCGSSRPRRRRYIRREAGSWRRSYLKILWRSRKHSGRLLWGCCRHIYLLINCYLICRYSNHGL